MANLQHYKLQEAWRILSLGICAHFNGEKHCGWANTVLQHTVQEAFCCNRFHIFFSPVGENMPFNILFGYLGSITYSQEIPSFFFF